MTLTSATVREWVEAMARAIRELWLAQVPVEAALAEGRDQWPWPTGAVARGYRQLELSAGRGSDG